MVRYIVRRGDVCIVHEGYTVRTDCRLHECEGALRGPNRFLRLPLWSSGRGGSEGCSSGGFVLTNSLGHNRFFYSAHLSACI